MYFGQTCSECTLLIYRNFRCDCGNSKFGDKECKLFPVGIILLVFFVCLGVCVRNKSDGCYSGMLDLTVSDLSR